MTAKTGKYAGDQLLHTISCDNDPTTVQFMYLPHHMVEANQVLNGLPCILYEELLINPNDFITRSGVERANMGIWDKEKHTFASPNKLHNEEATEGMFEDSGFMALYLDQDPQAALKKKMVNFDEADLQKACTYNTYCIVHTSEYALLIVLFLLAQFILIVD